MWTCGTARRGRAGEKQARDKKIASRSMAYRRIASRQVVVLFSFNPDVNLSLQPGLRYWLNQPMVLYS